MERIAKECPRCDGERGKWLGLDFKPSKFKGRGTWHPCFTCKTKGIVLVASEAEFKRLVRSITHPERVQTKQREKGE